MKMNVYCARSPAGFVCPATNGALNARCAPGTSPVGAICTPCAAGTYCADGISTAACTVGKFSVAGAADCSSCPAGYHCNDASHLPTGCGTGSYAPAGSAVCLHHSRKFVDVCFAQRDAPSLVRALLARLRIVLRSESRDFTVSTHDFVDLRLQLLV